MSSIMAKRIHEKRVEKGITMEELGYMCGVQKSAVNKWEKGLVSNMKRSVIERLSRIFNVSPAWLMGIDDKDDSISFESGLKDAGLLEKYHALNEKYQKAIDIQIDMYLQLQNEP